MALNEKQRNRIQMAFQSGNFDLNFEIENLTAQGMSKENAVVLIQAEVNAYRQKLFDEKVKKEDSEEYSKIAWIAVIMIGLIGPVFDISSIVWYAVACVLAGGVGYWAFKETPIAGLIGSCCFVFIIPFTYSWYISGRSSIIKIELLIPMALAILPSFLTGFIISKFLYPDK
jgi:hypothetical protein